MQFIFYRVFMCLNFQNFNTILKNSCSLFILYFRHFLWFETNLFNNETKNKVKYNSYLYKNWSFNDNASYGAAIHWQTCNFYYIWSTETFSRVAEQPGWNYFQSQQCFPLMLSHAEIYIFFFSFLLGSRDRGQSRQSPHSSLSGSQLTI